MATCAYIDLNPVTAGMAFVPEQSRHTSVKERIDHVKSQGRMQDLDFKREGSVSDVRVMAGLEDGLWLCPIEDRRNVDSTRRGVVEGFSLGRYLLLVEYTGRLIRHGKASISSELEGILERLGSSADLWSAQVQAMHKRTFVERFLAASRERLRKATAALGFRHVWNMGGCPAP